MIIYLFKNAHGISSSGNILSTNLFNDSSNNAVSVNVTPFGQDLSPQDVLLDIIGGIMTLYRGRKGVLVQEFTFSYAGLPVTGILQWPGRLPSRLTTEVLAEGLEQVAKKLAISRQYKEMMIEISENGEGLVARGSIRSKNPTTAILSLDTS